MISYLKSLYQEVVISTIDFLPQFLSGILVFLLFYAASILSNKIFERAAKNQVDSRHTAVIFLKKTVRIVILAVGIITMLGTWGINVSAIVAGLGLTGFALGFALHDALSSVLAGVLLLIYRPFSINDTISVCGIRGKVSSIDMRYTTVDSEGQKHLIPNSKLLSEMVTVG
jgi:small conductance mechanosensitive channel